MILLLWVLLIINWTSLGIVAAASASPSPGLTSLPPCSLGSQSALPVVLSSNTAYVLEDCYLQGNGSSASFPYVYTSAASTVSMLINTTITWRNVKGTGLGGLIETFQGSLQLDISLEGCDLAISGQYGLISLMGTYTDTFANHTRLRLSLVGTSLHFTVPMVLRETVATPILSTLCFDDGTLIISSCRFVANLTNLGYVSKAYPTAVRDFELTWILWTNFYRFDAKVWSPVGPRITLEDSTWTFFPTQADLMTDLTLSNFESYIVNLKYVNGGHVAVAMRNVTAELIGALTCTAIQFYRTLVAEYITVNVTDSTLHLNTTLDVSQGNTGRTAAVIYFSSSSVLNNSIVDVSNSTFTLVAAIGYTQPPVMGGTLTLAQTTVMMLGTFINSVALVRSNTVVISAGCVKGMYQSLGNDGGNAPLPLMLAVETASLAQFGVNATSQNSTIIIEDATLSSTQGVYPTSAVLDNILIQRITSYMSTAMSLPVACSNLTAMVRRVFIHVYDAVDTQLMSPSMSTMSFVSNFQAQTSTKRAFPVVVIPSQEVSIHVINCTIEDRRKTYHNLRGLSVFVLQGSFANVTIVAQRISVVAKAMLAIVTIASTVSLSNQSLVVCEDFTTPVAMFASAPVDWSPFLTSGVTQHLTLEASSRMCFSNLQVAPIAPLAGVVLSRSWIANVTVADRSVVELQSVNMVPTATCSHVLDSLEALDVGGKLHIHCAALVSAASGAATTVLRKLELRDIAVDGHSENMAQYVAQNSIAFQNCPLAPWWSRTVEIPQVAKRVETVSREVLRAISVMGGVANVLAVSGGISSFRGGGMSNIQTTSLMMLARRRCSASESMDQISDNGDTNALFLSFGQSLLDNPLQLHMDSFGDADVSYAAGTVIGNGVMLILMTTASALWDGRRALVHIVCSGGGGGVFLVSDQMKALWSVLSCRMPSSSFSSVTSLLQPTLTASIVLLVTPTPVIGAIALSVCVGLLGIVVIVAWLSHRLLRRRIPLNRAAMAQGLNRTPVACLHRLRLTSSTHWVPAFHGNGDANHIRTAREFKRRYERWTEEYREGFHHYSLVDLYQSVGTAVIGGVTIVPATTSCSTAIDGLWAISVVCLIFFVVFILNRPCESRASLMIGGGLQSMTVLAAILSLGKQEVAAAWVGFLQGVVVLVFSVLSLVLFVLGWFLASGEDTSASTAVVGTGIEKVGRQAPRGGRHLHLKRCASNNKGCTSDAMMHELLMQSSSREEILARMILYICDMKGNVTK